MKLSKNNNQSVSIVQQNSTVLTYTVWSKKTDPLVYFDDNFGKYGPI